GLADIDALVTLQPQQLPTGPPRQHFGNLGLADARLALQQEGTVQAQGQEDDGRQTLVGQVAVLGQGLLYCFDRSWQARSHSMSMLFPAMDLTNEFRVPLAVE